MSNSISKIAIFNGIRLDCKVNIESTMERKQVVGQDGSASVEVFSFKDDWKVMLEDVPVYQLKTGNGAGLPNPKLFGSNISKNAIGKLVVGEGTGSQTYSQVRICNHDYKTIVGLEATDRITLEFSVLSSHA